VRRVALVTGGAHGIGRGVALRLASDGWHVAIGYRASAEEAAETVGALQSKGVEAMAAGADLGDPAQAERLYAQVAATLGPPDALVHAAGPYHRRDVLAETPRRLARDDRRQPRFLLPLRAIGGAVDD
jgi:3-oxoacyl-[acyl-carrier protein] reductase